MSMSGPATCGELENVVERAMILSKGAPLAFEDLTRGRPDVALPDPEDERGEFLTLDEVNRRHIQRAVEATKGRVHGKEGAAEILGLKASTLRSRMKQLKVPFGRARS